MTAEHHVDLTVGQGQGAALLVVGRLMVGRRHAAPEPHGAVGRVHADQQVLGRAGLGDEVRQLRLRVVHTGAGDAEGVKVATGLLAQRHWRAHLDVPADGTGGHIQPVDLVRLGRRDHGAADHQRLPVHRAAEPG